MVGVGFRTTAFGWLSEYVAGDAPTARFVRSKQARRRLVTCVALATGALGMMGCRTGRRQTDPHRLCHRSDGLVRAIRQRLQDCRDCHRGD